MAPGSKVYHMKWSDRFWVTMLVLLPLIGVYRIGYYFWYHKQVIVKPLEGEWKNYGKCKRDSECAKTANPNCSGCGCGVYINRESLGNYMDQLKKQCQGESGQGGFGAGCPPNKGPGFLRKFVGEKILSP